MHPIESGLSLAKSASLPAAEKRFQAVRTERFPILRSLSLWFVRNKLFSNQKLSQYFSFFVIQISNLFTKIGFGTPQARIIFPHADSDLHFS
ncbi:MAG: hypothetical protein ACOY90_16130 [Candidatus Zhuqueibacterota bacterium]